MLHTGLDLSRKRLDVEFLNEDGTRRGHLAVAPGADGLTGVTRLVAERYSQPVQAATESINGARCVHHQLERPGWQVQLADAQRTKGLAPLRSLRLRIGAFQ